jgi:outer membrane lipoprotein SlyB
MRRVIGGLVLIVFGLWAAGCAGTQPSVYAYPAKGQTAEQQSRDMNECQAWAKQQTGFDPTTDTAKGAGLGALIGAAGGAAAGAAIGAATGSPGTGAAIGAAAGGIGGAGVGGTLGYTKNKEGYDKAYAACMQTRGYTVK